LPRLPSVLPAAFAAAAAALSAPPLPISWPGAAWRRPIRQAGVAGERLGPGAQGQGQQHGGEAEQRDLRHQPEQQEEQSEEDQHGALRARHDGRTAAGGSGSAAARD
jgi:hypothetical protein